MYIPFPVLRLLQFDAVHELAFIIVYFYTNIYTNRVPLHTLSGPCMPILYILLWNGMDFFFLHDNCSRLQMGIYAHTGAYMSICGYTGV